METKQQQYPIGKQNFAVLRQEDYLYVDKTALIYQLTRNRYSNFLSRPRRFGKSLLVSTLKAYFQGQKELFRGLAIEQMEQDWTAYPVLHLDFSTGSFNADNDELSKFLNHTLTEWERRYGREASEETFSLRFKGVIKRACEQTGQPVVVLVDEYDKPLLATAHDSERNDRIRNTLKSFYSVLKTQDEYLRFAFLTGITRFSRVSIFSDLNNLNDISMNKEYASLCGITEEELHHYFDEAVARMAANMEITTEAMYEKLRRQYDGYHFCRGTEGLYNPFSLLNAFYNQEFGDYWFASGTPTFLVEMLRRENYDLRELSGVNVTAGQLRAAGKDLRNIESVMFQSGYLTIVDYDAQYDRYILDFPNDEVRKGFFEALLPYYMPRGGSGQVFSPHIDMTEALQQGNPQDFVLELKKFFDSSDYRMVNNKEIYFQSVIYILLRLMGLYVQVEYATRDGRIDVVVTTNNYRYVIELKRDSSARVAMNQIHDKDYPLAFAADHRKLYKIALNFSFETNSFTDDWLIED